MNAAIYCRVSTAKQAETGLSLEAAEQRCREFAQRQGYDLEDRHVFIERGVSGAKSKRPRLDALLRAVDAGEVDVLIAPWIDRIGRSAAHTHALFARFEDAAGLREYMEHPAHLAVVEKLDATTTGRIVADYEF